MTPDTTTHHILTAGSLPALASLVDELGLSNRFSGDASLTGTDPVIRSRHHLGEASATAQLLIGIAGAAIWEARTGASIDIAINIIDALHFLHPTHFGKQAGRSMNIGAEHVAVNNVFRCADSQYVMLEAGPPYAKLLDGYLDFFDCGNNRDSLAREVAKWTASDFEDVLSAKGLPVCIARTSAEWRAHPQGIELAHTPVVEIEKIADGDPVPFPSEGPLEAPLSGVRVLDFTHVLAGPRSTGTLAEYGADVLHISAPFRRDTVAQDLGVDIGKRNAYLDLGQETDLNRMQQLAREADVLTTTYRPDVNRRFRLEPASLADGHRGIVTVAANAYGHTGPWADRPGFDQNGQVATGFARTEGSDGVPKFSPVFYLADLMTGYLAAAGTMAALLRRSTEGGSYAVRVSLARSTMWVQDLGLLTANEQDGAPETDNYPAATTSFPTVYGDITQLAPPLTFTNLRLPPVTRLTPYGSDPASWDTP